MRLRDLDIGWQRQLQGEIGKGYMQSLDRFLTDRRYSGATIYPPHGQIFKAFSYTPFDAVKVVILGQDPYHGAGQAHGLSFSVPDGVRPPPSLRNIFTELMTDLGVERPKSGNLEPWAQRGVLLLNSCLTVEEGQAGIHQGKGWEQFTDAAITQLNRDRQHLVFILWGRKAQEKGAVINRERHLVIEAPHPSPFSAHSGFFGTKPFSQANSYLAEHNIIPVDWQL